MSSAETPPEFRCPECEEVFSRREHLQRHSRTHTKERPFKCSGCDESFARIDSLGRHYSTIHARDSSLEGPEVAAAKTKRVTKACSSCSRSKVRCDGQLPCQRCLSSKNECNYEPSKKRKRISHVSKSDDSSSQHVSPAPHLSVQEHNSPSGQTQPQPLPQPQPHSQPQISNTAYGSNITPIVDNCLPTILPTDGYGNLQSVYSGPSPSWQTDPNYEYTDFPLNVGFDPCDEIYELFNMSIDTIPMGVTPFFWSNPLMMLDFDTTNPQPPFIMPSSEINNVHNSSSTQPLQKSPENIMSPQYSVADTYNKVGTPILDKDHMNVRHYRPTTALQDVQLSFPDMSSVSDMEIDEENTAQVKDFDDSFFKPLVDMEERLARHWVFPHRREKLKLPSTKILNAWTQLFFEHFHQMFPILHQPTYGTAETHWLLAFTVACIGAKYSKMKMAHECSLAMQELVRRQAAYLCENDNHYAQQLWMAQVTVLSHLTLMYCGDRRTLEFAEVMQSIPTALARRRGLLEDVFSHEKLPSMNLSSEQLWRLWVHDEERRRLGYGTWLVDSTFALHFDLSQLMTVDEMRNSLPCAEFLWEAKTAQSWSSSFSGLVPKKPPNLIAAIGTSQPQAVWSSIGNLGKQTILHSLAKVIRGRDFIPLGVNDESLSRARKTEALTKLEKFTQTLSPSSESIFESRFDTVLRLSVLMTKVATFCNAAADLPGIAFRCLYGALDDEQVRASILELTYTPQNARQSMLYAGDIYVMIRDKRPNYVSDPIMLLRTTIIIYMYVKYEFNDPSLPALRVWNLEQDSFFLQSSAGEKQVNDWVTNGVGRPKLPGIGTLCTKQGRIRLLKVSGELMAELKVWRVSRSYGKILAKLMEMETGEVPSQSA